MPEVTLSVTSTAVPPAFVPTSVLSVVGMPRRTVPSLALYPPCHPPMDVLLLRDVLQVLRVDAMMHPTEVIDLKPWRNGANQQFISVSVSGHHVPTVPECPVVTASLPSHPYPTRPKIRSIGGDGAILVNLGPEALFRRPLNAGRGECVCRAMPLPARVVHEAPSATLCLTFASGDRTGRLCSHREFTPRGVIGPDVCALRPSSILQQMGEAA